MPYLVLVGFILNTRWFNVYFLLLLLLSHHFIKKRSSIKGATMHTNESNGTSSSSIKTSRRSGLYLSLPHNPDLLCARNLLNPIFLIFFSQSGRIGPIYKYSFWVLVQGWRSGIPGVWLETVITFSICVALSSWASIGLSLRINGGRKKKREKNAFYESRLRYVVIQCTRYFGRDRSRRCVMTSIDRTLQLFGSN